MKPKITVFGEMLWDMLPSGKQPGGAPMNVAIHLKNFDMNPAFISRVGDDDLGAELMEYLHHQNFNTDFIQTGITHLTGIVKVNLTDKTEVTYKIVQPVAWDYIQTTPENKQLVKDSDVFVYGTLSVRSQQSRDTLFELLKDAKLKVFDVNIRPPHLDRATTEYLLQQADIVKVNEHELNTVCTWFGIQPELETQMKFLYERFNLKLVCVTLGADGAIVLSGDGFHSQRGYVVEVQDTIGSGDSFLAMFLKEYVSGLPIPSALTKACAVGALVASYNGATPDISESELDHFLTVNQ
ncbi:carbohydrate kinase [Dyadobacter chenwenxiniae]|uniref:Carbohydrate kinase n=1 Tax=Dyadobacter chenwenxiniae TaxID=2906456 RepID=A0A9X1PQP1_9BACT|nr:carbohydrate kinase [Dyadobacter chenwenxiniae]MCF0064669.1 carbohydrate kinase [Dyadobacter chenwenxiniae]UON84277.1 carbohydrate kinase [Dyadobacter chenwenxiniae]